MLRSTTIGSALPILIFKTYSKAEESFHEALRRDSHPASSHFGLARIYRRQQKFGPALAAVKAAEKIDANNPNHHNLEGQILIRMGAHERGAGRIGGSDYAPERQSRASPQRTSRRRASPAGVEFRPEAAMTPSPLEIIFVISKIVQLRARKASRAARRDV
jgi:tetratricopeptide (TPR) repeat protein